MTETANIDRTTNSGSDSPIDKSSTTAPNNTLFEEGYEFKKQAQPIVLNQSDKVAAILPTGTVDSDGALIFTVASNADLAQLQALSVPEPGDDTPDKGSVSRDATGKVTHVAYPNGKGRDFGYDDEGNLKTIKQIDGTTWEIQDGKWSQKPSGKGKGDFSSGKTETPVNSIEPGLGRQIFNEILNPQVSADGTFSYSTKDGKHFAVTADGVQTTKNDSDKSTITSDVNDRVTKIEYADGRSRQFDYGSKGTLLRYTDVHGDTYSLKDGKYIDTAGKDSGLTNIVPSSNGDVSFSKDGKSIVAHTNQSKSITNENSSVTTEDENGDLASVKYGNGLSRAFTFDKGILSEFTDPEGHSYKYRDGKWLNDAGQDSGLSQVKVDKEGALTYLDQEHRVTNAGTDGTITATTQTLEQIQAAAQAVRSMAMDHNSFETLAAIAGMTTADRLVLQQEYEKQYGAKLAADIKKDLQGAEGTRAIGLLYEANLEEYARKSLSGIAGADGKTEREKFLENIQTFKTRATEAGMADAQIASVYESVNKLFEADQGKVSEQWRHRLAAQIMDQAANPDTADQGYHGTCQMTSVEGRTWWRHPEIAAGMISQIATTGEWTSYDGKTITIPDGALIPDGESRIYPKTDNYRSFASQIFQVGVFNDWGQRENPPHWYTLQRPQGEGAADDGWLLSRDGTDVLRNKKDEVIKYAFGFAEIGLYNQRLSGFEGKTTLMNAQYGYGDSPTVGTFRDADELGRIIEENKLRGNMPIAIGVAGGDHTIFGGDQGRSDSDHQVNHVILINDYDPKTGMVKLNNSWGPDQDKWVKLEDLYFATGKFDQPPRRGGYY